MLCGSALFHYDSQVALSLFSTDAFFDFREIVYLAEISRE
jgi:hypothetical protein